MPTRNVVLTDRQAELIEDLVESGHYQNASEVLREGIRLVEQRIAEDRARLAKLRAEIQVGLDDVEAGRVSPRLSGAALRKHLRSLMKPATKRGRARRLK